MPYRKTVSSKVQWLIDNLSIGQLQAGFDVLSQKRTSTPHTKKGWTLSSRIKRVQGTKIPAPVFLKFKSREWTPREKSIKRLEAMYRRWAYNTLRSAGIPLDRLNRYISDTPKKIVQTAKDYDRYTRIIAKDKKVDQDIIRFGLSQSGHGKETWDWYVKVKPYQRPGYQGLGRLTPEQEAESQRQFRVMEELRKKTRKKKGTKNARKRRRS